MQQRDARDSLQIRTGERLKLADGSTVVVKDNPMDGVWLFCEYLNSPDSSLIGTEQPVYGTDVVDFVSEDTK
ncbi:hypothetical protein Z051_23965 [Rhodococcus rhodochrous KG-21]|uniref:SH3 domain-containing protein n=1 Tax=Rhodococcus rhodochrous KG-21 TaxID=1441923 RepID=A0A0M8PCG5_RHORH|nr:hypothetical protein Z051_23965 [Rhodococcus rhodochrous KG-21]